MGQGNKTQWLKGLFINGAYINWLAPISMSLYGIVTLGCLNSKMLVTLYLAAISPSAGTIIRIGYFGVCIQTPESLGWTCSRFIKGAHGLSATHLSLIKSVKSMQWNSLYPLPALAAILLLILYTAFLVFRNRSETKTRYIIMACWVSCAIGFAGALIPMMLGQAMFYAAPVYGSKVSMEISLGNIVLTWIAFSVHLGWILFAVWWHRRMGVGEYGSGGYGMDEEEGEMEMDPRRDPRYAQQAGPPRPAR